MAPRSRTAGEGWASVRDALRCPACGSDLRWLPSPPDRAWAPTSRATCVGCGRRVPIQHGIANLLPDPSALGDSWATAETSIDRHLRDHPEAERRLMGRSVEGLTPADLMLRAMVLEGRGKPREASVWAERAREGLYTTEYRNALESQLACVARRVRGSVTPVVDLASGRGVLVERLLAEGGTVLATDVSPRVLRWTLRRLRSRARPHRLAGAALDARQLPFRDGSVPTMTTLLGLQNIDAPGPLLRELRRVVSGRLLAVCQFLAPGDEPNRRSLRERGVEALFLRSRCEAAFRAAGWRAEVENLVTAQARPTPTSSVLPGVGIDGFPVAPTELEWGVLVAR